MNKVSYNARAIKFTFGTGSATCLSGETLITKMSSIRYPQLINNDGGNLQVRVNIDNSSHIFSFATANVAMTVYHWLVHISLQQCENPEAEKAAATTPPNPED